LPAYAEENNPRLRFDLWHVFDQGTNELWGLHTTDAETPVPYVYLDSSEPPLANWPYGVNVTSGARLNIAKLHTGSAVCPATATGVTQSPYKDGTNLGWFFNTTSKTGYWIGAPYYTDMVYGSELNIKGSYVYGYNWNLRSQAVPPDVNKAGW
jgi:hypothetical protein